MILCGIAGAAIGGAIGAVVGYLGRCTSGACPFTTTPLRGIVVGAALGLFIAISSYDCPWGGNTACDKNARQGGLYIETMDDFQKLVIESPRPVLVDFYSPTCPPCRRLSPTIVALKGKYSGKADIYKVDVTLLSELAARRQITVVPTVSFLVGGKEVDRITGNNYESVYSAILDRFIQ